MQGDHAGQRAGRLPGRRCPWPARRLLAAGSATTTDPAVALQIGPYGASDASGDEGAAPRPQDQRLPRPLAPLGLRRQPPRSAGAVPGRPRGRSSADGAGPGGGCSDTGPAAAPGRGAGPGAAPGPGSGGGPGAWRCRARWPPGAGRAGRAPRGPARRTAGCCRGRGRAGAGRSSGPAAPVRRRRGPGPRARRRKGLHRLRIRRVFLKSRGRTLQLESPSPTPLLHGPRRCRCMGRSLTDRIDRTGHTRRSRGRRRPVQFVVPVGPAIPRAGGPGRSGGSRRSRGPLRVRTCPRPGPPRRPPEGSLAGPTPPLRLRGLPLASRSPHTWPAAQHADGHRRLPTPRPGIPPADAAHPGFNQVPGRCRGPVSGRYGRRETGRKRGTGRWRWGGEEPRRRGRAASTRRSARSAGSR